LKPALFIFKQLYLLIFLATIPVTSLADSRDISTQLSISSLCQHSPIVLLGETHHMPDSQLLFVDLVQLYVEQSYTVYVGLEIPADKQPQLDDALAGGSDFSLISPIILHAQYKEMIHALGRMKGNIKVHAIDAGDDEQDRDIAMSRNLVSAIFSRKYDNFLELVGNIHVIKNIQWLEGLEKTEVFCRAFNGGWHQSL
jgi:hypothetical protein